jgi:pimeloyl-ACP methyl ester carboxylesterase
LALGAGGCADHLACPRVIYLDGAGWYSGDGPVRRGLRAAGFAGRVDRFGWQSLLGALHDHVMAGQGHPDVPRLARRIEELREANPDGKIVLMGLSAGTSLIVAALERLAQGVEVDHVVLLSPSVSSEHDLREALRHVRGRMYATHSPHDSLLAGVASAGLEHGRPAGQVGFQRPRGLSPEGRRLYRKLVNLPWRGEYAAYGWNGGHVSVTRQEFIRAVIAPRVLQDAPHPLDRRAADRQGSAE